VLTYQKVLNSIKLRLFAPLNLFSVLQFENINPKIFNEAVELKICCPGFKGWAW